MGEKIEKAGDLLGVFLSGKQFEEGTKWVSFFNFWKKLLGERLATHSHIRDVRNGALIIEADHPGWIQMLQLKQSEILDEIKKKFPDVPITSIHIRLSERKFWAEESVDRKKEDAEKNVSGEDTDVASENHDKSSGPEGNDEDTPVSENNPIERIRDGSF